jgi:hypothetical protein
MQETIERFIALEYNTVVYDHSGLIKSVLVLMKRPTRRIDENSAFTAGDVTVAHIRSRNRRASNPSFCGALAREGP